MAGDEGLTPENGHWAVLADEFEERTAVVINEGNILIRVWRIAALNNLVRLTRNDDSGMPGMPTTDLSPAGKSINR